MGLCILRQTDMVKIHETETVLCTYLREILNHDVCNPNQLQEPRDEAAWA